MGNSSLQPDGVKGIPSLNTTKKQKIRLVDVAKDAGVSTATASLVVRRSALVSEKTREKVLEAMKRLGYVHDRIAASLRSQASSTVSVIISDIGNPFLSEILVGLHQELNDMGYNVLLGTTFDSIEKQQHLIETMIGHKICGLILSPVGSTTPDELAVLDHSNVPVVLIGRELTVPNRYDHVVADNFGGARLAVQHLIDSGHRRIAFLGGVEEVAVYKHRLAGYEAALTANGIFPDRSLVLQGPSTFEVGDLTIRTVLEHANPPTAAFCYNDIVAIGSILGLKKKGLLAGRDFGLVGFDDIKQATITNPALTTISIDLKQWGPTAARLLDKRIKGSEGPPEKIVFPPELVIRESSKVMERVEAVHTSHGS